MAYISDKRRQRFVSILCRYPYITLDGADEDKSIINAKKARLKWEIAALKRKGGYEVRENNLFLPNSGEMERIEGVDESLSNESYREMCKIHSVGCKAGFVDFVNNLSSTILESLAEYKQTFTFDRLLKAVGTKFSADEVFIVHQDISLIESALKENKLTAWGDLVFENPLSCKACRVSLPLSESSTIEFLIHLADTSESERLRQYIDCVIEQASLIYTQLDHAFIKKMYKNVSILEQEVFESSIESSNPQSKKTSTITGVSFSRQPSDPHRPAPKRPVTNKPKTSASDAVSIAQPRPLEPSVTESVQKGSVAGTSKASANAGSSKRGNRHRRPRKTMTQRSEIREEALLIFEYQV